MLVLASKPFTNPCPAEDFRAGPLYDEFRLTLAPGDRTEALGPLFYVQESGAERIWAVPPVVSLARDSDTGLREFDVLYPIFTSDHYGAQYRWQLFQLLSFTRGPMPEENNRERFTVFPIYFRQRSTDPSQDYTAVFPFYGHLKHRFFRDEVFFVMWPGYCQTRKGDLVTDNYLVPFFDLRHGPGMRGWQFFPIAGHDHKEVTTQTNGFGDVKTIGGYDKRFILWPLYFNDTTGIGTDNQAWNLVSFPLFSLERSPKRDSTSVAWLFGHVTEREKKYREWDTPWPFIVFARGKGKTVNRVFPLFSRLETPTQEENSYGWPVYKYNRVRSAPMDRRRSRVLFWVYSDLLEKNTETGAERQRLDVWPLLLHTRDFNGNSRWQVLALLEAFVPGSHKFTRDWSPLWSIWRSEKSPRTGASSQSLLWNLYRHDVTSTSRKTSFLLGLFQSETNKEGKHVRLFYIPLGRAKASSKEGVAQNLDGASDVPKQH